MIPLNNLTAILAILIEHYSHSERSPSVLVILSEASPKSGEAKGLGCLRVNSAK